MDNKIQVLEVLVQHNKDMVLKQNEELDAIKRSVQDTAVVLAELKTKMAQVDTKVDNYSKGINRALWMIGGGFLSAIVGKFTGAL